MIITSSLYLIVSLKVNEADIRKLIMREIVCKGNIKLCNHSILWPFDWLEVIQLSCIKFSEFAKALLNSYIPPKRSDRINWKIEIKVFKSSWKSQSPTKTKVVVLPPSCFAVLHQVLPATNQGNRSARPGVEIALEQKLRDSPLTDVTHVLKCFAMLLFRDHTQLYKSERILSKTFVCEY